MCFCTWVELPKALKLPFKRTGHWDSKWYQHDGYAQWMTTWHIPTRTLYKLCSPIGNTTCPSSRACFSKHSRLRYMESNCYYSKIHLMFHVVDANGVRLVSHVYTQTSKTQPVNPRRALYRTWAQTWLIHKTKPSHSAWKQIMIQSISFKLHHDECLVWKWVNHLANVMQRRRPGHGPWLGCVAVPRAQKGSFSVTIL